MKNLSITLITTMVLLASGLTYAQDTSPEPRKPHQHKQHKQRGMQMPVVTHVFRSFRQLDLDEAQKIELKSIFQAMRQELKPIMKEMKKGQKQLRDQLHAGTFDEAAIEAIALKEGELTTQRLMVTSRAISTAFALLSDEQRAQLEANAAERRAKRGERHYKRQAES